ncbi:MAG: site-specific integrase [Lysinibacillus sp.]
MSAIRIPKKTDVIRKKKIPGEEDVFFSNYYSREELNEFLACTETHCSPLKHTFFTLLAHCGLRCGEAFALNWKDIDVERKLIHVTKSAAYVKEKNMFIKNTKNYLSRKVNIDDETLRLLLEWKAQQQLQLKMKGQQVQKDHVQLVFQNGKNGITNPSQTSSWLKSLYKKCKLRKITVHGLRHTHCTLGLQSRAFTIEEMMNRLGHKDVITTMLVYTHVTETTMQDNPATYMEFLAEGPKERRPA